MCVFELISILVVLSRLPEDNEDNDQHDDRVSIGGGLNQSISMHFILLHSPSLIAF